MVMASGWHSFDRQFEPYLRAFMAEPLRCGLGCRSRTDGRIHRSWFFCYQCSAQHLKVLGWIWPFLPSPFAGSGMTDKEYPKYYVFPTDQAIHLPCSQRTKPFISRWANVWPRRLTDNARCFMLFRDLAYPPRVALMSLQDVWDRARSQWASTCSGSWSVIGESWKGLHTYCRTGSLVVIASLGALQILVEGNNKFLNQLEVVAASSSKGE